MYSRSSERSSLFSDGDAFTLIDQRKKQIAQEIDGFDRNRILNASVEDLCAYIEEKFRLDTPVLEDDQAAADQNEGMVDVYDAYRSSRYGDGGPIRVKGTIVDLAVPFTGDGALFRIRPTSFDSMPPSGDVQGNTLMLKVSGAGLKAEEVRKQLDRELASIKKYLNWLRGSTDPFNAGIREMARQAIETRRHKLLADQNLVASLGFALKKRADAPQTYAVPIKQRKIDPRPPSASTAPFKPEPALEEAEYENILKIMENMTLVLERNPTAFGGMEEEDLRSHFLVPLNGQYEGQATGETFNFQGKTDILIRVEGKNIFIAECKIWRGEKSFTEAIDQLLSYLSWRDTKAAIVVFNRNKGFSDVLQKILNASEAHPLFKSGPTVQGETRFRYVFGQKDDPNREVMLTVLAFDVPQAEAKKPVEPRVRTVV